MPCEYDSCPIGSPAEGNNASMPRFNYVNSYPVTSIRYGIQTLSPKYFGGAPDIAVAGFNVGGKQLSKVPFHRNASENFPLQQILGPQFSYQELLGQQPRLQRKAYQASLSVAQPGRKLHGTHLFKRTRPYMQTYRPMSPRH